MSAVPAWMGDAAEASPPVAPRGWRALSDRQRGWILAVSLLLLLAAVAVVLPWLAPYDPAAIKLSARLRPPVWEARGTWSNVLGTDNLGRDVLSRILHGARLSILIGAAVVAV
ncbi:MAG: ABC transporter permease, partial [Achromobacter sp.]